MYLAAFARRRVGVESPRLHFCCSCKQQETQSFGLCLGASVQQRGKSRGVARLPDVGSDLSWLGSADYYDLLRRTPIVTARWGGMGRQQTPQEGSRARHTAPRRQGARVNQTGRHTTTCLASASRCAKPRLGDYQRCFLGSYPSSLTGAYLVLRPCQLVASPIGSR